MMEWAGLERPSLARVRPTPLERHPSLSAELGVEVLIKREDLIDDMGSGNKVRKLEWVLAHARAEGADTLITAGSAQSNQTKALAVAARRFHMRCRIVACDVVPPPEPRGNLLVCLLHGPVVEWHPNEAWPRVLELMEEAARQERALGHRPYIVPPGASDWPGSLGHIETGLELAEQERGLPRPIDHVVVPTGSGGTHVGIAVGAALAGRPWCVSGVAVLGDEPYFARRNQAILSQLVARGLPASGVPETLPVHPDPTRGGYAAWDEPHLGEMRRLAEEHGVLLDPVYMLKAWRGLVGLARDGVIRPGAVVVLVHTGGQLGLLGDARVQAALQSSRAGLTRQEREG